MNTTYNISITPFSKISSQELFDALKLRTDVFVVEQNCIYPEVDDVDLKAYHLLCYSNKIMVGYLRIYLKDETNNVFSFGRVVIPKAIEERVSPS